MTLAKEGDYVKIHLTFTVEDGTVISTREGGEPLEFVIGSGAVAEFVDETLKKMSVGDVQERPVTKEEGMPRNEDLVMEFQKTDFPGLGECEPGQVIPATLDNGAQIYLPIVSATEKTVTVDGNPPVAGKEFVAKVELISIGEPAAEDLES